MIEMDMLELPILRYASNNAGTYNIHFNFQFFPAGGNNSFFQFLPFLAQRIV